MRNVSPVLLIGLRDYGTASWQGGDAACDHSGIRRNHEDSKQATSAGSSRDPVSRNCRKCGATRVDQQIGLEPTVEAYVAQLVAVFREVRRVLRDDGVLFLNLGDSYASHDPGGYREGEFLNPGGRPPTKQGSHRNRAGTYRPDGLKKKDLIGIPWRVAFALQADGWYLRSDIIWAKPNPMPESVRDRPTKAHEYIFLFSKQPRYFWDAEAVKEPSVGPWNAAEGFGTNGKKSEGIPWLRTQGAGSHHDDEEQSGRNIRSVWSIATAPWKHAHFATFPPALAERCIKAGTSEKGACGACGAPWWRTIERESMEIMRSNRGLEIGKEFGRTQASGTMTKPASSRTIGWEPTCSCDAGEPISCVVLDPFGGAGTVSLVAERLGRDSIYIDLSPEYAAMAKTRITGDAPMFARVEVQAEMPTWYVCEDCGIRRQITELTSGCPSCGQTMVPA